MNMIGGCLLLHKHIVTKPTSYDLIFENKKFLVYDIVPTTVVLKHQV